MSHLDKTKINSVHVSITQQTSGSPKLDTGEGEGTTGVIGAGDGPLDELTEVGSTVVCGIGVPISVGVVLDILLALLFT